MVDLVAYIDLEENITGHIAESFARFAAPILKLIEEAVDRNDWATAYALVDTLTFGPVIDAEKGFLHGALEQAYLFGQQILSPLSETLVATTGAFPEEVESATEGLSDSLVLSATEAVKTRVRAVVALAEDQNRRSELEEVRTILKADIDFALAAALNSATAAGTKVAASAGANLTTSKLVAFGFLDQAQEQGVKTFQISAILDTRTCAVCRRMHGMTFSVPQARTKLQYQLGQQDASALKAAFPFPKATAAGIQQLTGMTREQLQQRGWDTPPFHPNCRCVLVPVGTVEPLKLPRPNVPKNQKLPGATVDGDLPGATAQAQQDVIEAATSSVDDLPPTKPTVDPSTPNAADWQALLDEAFAVSDEAAAGTGVVPVLDDVGGGIKPASTAGDLADDGVFNIKLNPLDDVADAKGVATVVDDFDPAYLMDAATEKFIDVDTVIDAMRLTDSKIDVLSDGLKAPQLKFAQGKAQDAAKIQNLKDGLEFSGWTPHNHALPSQAGADALFGEMIDELGFNVRIYWKTLPDNDLSLVVFNMDEVDPSELVVRMYEKMPKKSQVKFVPGGQIDFFQDSATVATIQEAVDLAEQRASTGVASGASSTDFIPGDTVGGFKTNALESTLPGERFNRVQNYVENEVDRFGRLVQFARNTRDTILKNTVGGFPDEFKAAIAMLTEEETAAVFGYTSSGYMRVNRALREFEFKGTAPDAETLAFRDATNEGLRRFPAYEGDVVRGITVSESIFEKVLERYTTGTVVKERSFLSTSTASGFGGNVEFRIMAKGGKGHRLGSFSRHPSEGEVLFQSDTKFRVLDVDVTARASSEFGTRRATVYLEEVLE